MIAPHGLNPGKVRGKVDELSWIADEFSNVDWRSGRAITEL
jgi:hypothetical protein